MTEENKLSYPNIPVIHWWTLRNKFKSSIPPLVTPSYLAAVLTNMKEHSAKANIIPSLIQFKIIDEDMKPTERARLWRDDEQYPLVCEAIIKEVYPQELVDALPGPKPERGSVVRWFQSKTGSGESGATRWAIVYELLCEKNPLVGQDSKKNTKRPRINKKTEVVEVAKPDQYPPAIKVKPLGKENPNYTPDFSPNIHIDIQIHISPDSSSTQIDEIFAAMAKHLYKKVN